VEKSPTAIFSQPTFLKHWNVSFRKKKGKKQRPLLKPMQIYMKFDKFDPFHENPDNRLCLIFCDIALAKFASTKIV